MDEIEDRRPDAPPRKLIELWQAYKWWDDLTELAKAHGNRITSADRHKSDMDSALEQDMMEGLNLEEMREVARKLMVGFGKDAGPIWDWVTSIRGLGAGSDAAKLLAQIDDIGKFDTVSKLWRFCGYAVIDGEVERKRKGEELHYNRRLKAILWDIGWQFVKHRPTPYRERYDEYKARDRRNHPNVICRNCGAVFPPTVKKCPECKRTNKEFGLMYCDAHLDARARRAAVKLFLSHLWDQWRRFEGLPVSEPYVEGVLGHTHIVPPPA